MARPATDDRLRRLLALVPWVAAQEGPTIDEVCARFGCTEQELAEDLERLFMCGLYPFTPDTMIEVDMDDGRVWIRYADVFSRPLRLTPAEGEGTLCAALFETDDKTGLTKAVRPIRVGGRLSPAS